MKRRWVLLGLAVIVGCLLVLAACPSPMQVENGGGDTGELGTFHIRLGSGSVSRAVVPYPPTTQTELDQLTFKVQFIKNGSVIATFNSDGDDRIDGKVAQGTYTVRVEVSIIADGTLFAAGSKDPITIKPGPNPTITVEVYEAGVVTIDPAVVSLNAGTTQQFTATVSGYTNQGVSWTLSSGVPGTDISAGGLLTIDIGETATSLTVTATSVADPTRSGTATVAVVPPGALTGSVSISGSPVAGQTLSVNASSLGGSGAISYLWETSSDDVTYATTGVTTSTYSLTSTDNGKYIRVRVERPASNPLTYVYSAGVLISLPALTGTVTISGTPEVGQTLTAVTTGLGGSGTIHYQWERADGGPTIVGSDSSTYALVTADDGYDILVRVTRDGYSSYVYNTNTVTVSLPFVPVTAITGPTPPWTITVGTFDLTAAVTVTPSTATNQTIVWSVQNAGTTGATISGNNLTTTAAGTVVVRATITNGATASTNYTQDFTITVSAAFVPVTNITGVPTTATVGTPRTLTGTVAPAGATNQTIEWSLSPLDAGTTGASVSLSAGVYTLSTTTAGTATIRATITNGATASTDYTQDFSITVSGATTSGSALLAKTISDGTGSAAFNAVAVASDGVYAVGYQNGTGSYDYGGSSIPINGTASSDNPVLVKYDASGNAVWARTIYAYTPVSSAQFNAVAVAPDGSVYVAGYQEGSGSYYYGGASTPISGTASTNPVLIKYDTSGNAVWAKTVSSGSSLAVFTAVAVAPDGYVYAAGYQHASGYVDYGGISTPLFGTGSGSSYFNSVLVKYDTSGNALWAKTISAGTDAQFSAVAVASDGVYAAGYQRGTGSYNYGGSSAPISGTAISGSSYNSVLVKYDTSGNAQWAKTVFAGTSDSLFNAVAVASDGVYAAGYQGGGQFYNYGGASTPIIGSSSPTSPVLVKYDTSGNAQWAKTVSASVDRASFNAVAVAPDGYVYAAGFQYGIGSFDYGGSSTPIGGTASTNSVLVKYDTSGNAVWAKTISAATNYAQFSAVAVASDGIYAAGYQNGTGSYNYGDTSTPITIGGTASGSNPVLVKYVR